MDIIVVSSPTNISGEIQIINKLFNNGLETFHIRKPNFSDEKLEFFLNQIPEKHLEKVILHSHYKLAKKFKIKGIHLTRRYKSNKFKKWWRLLFLRYSNPRSSISTSFHSISSILTNTEKYHYIFLSPVFDSISKKGHMGDFTDRNLTSSLKRTKQKMYALGGVSSDNIPKAHALGFSGVALLGAIWQDDRDPIDEFIKARKLCEDLGEPVFN
ncbi:MAG: thiamine phosphate synthase [Flavobacteriales bacterium]|nr:thiamine phosphate synthase [Flavobacteriales bacterium]